MKHLTILIVLFLASVATTAPLELSETGEAGDCFIGSADGTYYLYVSGPVSSSACKSFGEKSRFYPLKPSPTPAEQCPFTLPPSVDGEISSGFQPHMLAD